MKINELWGGLTDVSVKKEALAVRLKPMYTDDTIQPIDHSELSVYICTKKT